MSLEITLTASRLAAASRARVWEVFSRLVDWPSWNPDCRGVRMEGGARLEADSRFELRLSPLGLPVTVRARVLESLPERRVTWQGSILGLETRHTFSFSDLPGGVLVQSRERLTGWPLLWLKPFYSLGRLGRRNQQWLAALARQAEAAPGSRPPSVV